jgi:hypothetical protein
VAWNVYRTLQRLIFARSLRHWLLNDAGDELMTDSGQTRRRSLATAALAAGLTAQDPQVGGIVGGWTIDPSLKSAGDPGVERNPCLARDAREGLAFDRDAGSTA